MYRGPLVCPPLEADDLCYSKYLRYRTGNIDDDECICICYGNYCDSSQYVTNELYELLVYCSLTVFFDIGTPDILEIIMSSIPHNFKKYQM